MTLTQRIYARNTVVKSIELTEAQDFVEKYHRQFSSRTQRTVISLGIFDKKTDELIAVAQFCSPRTAAKKQKYTTELLRMAFKENIRVVGGASKLIKHYIVRHDPSDIFTYQDTTNENTNVYENCGFKLVKKDSKKQYLIAPGKTFNNAGRNEKLSFAYAVQLGPDNIIGTNLGEVFNEDGTRKTNIDLFLDLGWHIKETTGDKTYEWINPDKTHYTYKITATDSDKYYYGVSHVKIKNATVEDCLKHDYFGSGEKWNKNNKFNNWKMKHLNNLRKEVIQTFGRKMKAYEAEKELIGDSWAIDPLCLNSVPGGGYTGLNTGNSARVDMKECSIHGLTKHLGKTCAKCVVSKSVTIKECIVHGSSKHIGKTCYRCTHTSAVTLKNCLVHGLTKYAGETCYQCVSDKNVQMKDCEVHGSSKHIGNSCAKCVNEDLVKTEECLIHGLTKHRAGNCGKCVISNSISLKNCLVHGLTKHMGNTCSNCTADKAITMKVCEIHGETKHTGDRCAQCRSSDNVTLKNCNVHGLVKHVGDKCYKCRNMKYILNNCEVHGETHFVNDKCLKCRENIVELKICVTHGETKHMGGYCAACRSQDAINMGECLIHGLTKHRGKSCSKCTADKAAHRYHIEAKGKTKKDCSLCDKEIAEGVRKSLVEKKPLVNVCELCGKEFTAKNKNQRFCSNPHSWNCAVCNDAINPVPRKDKKHYSCFKRDCRRTVSSL